MTLQDLQDRVDEWIGQYKDGYWSPHEMLARLFEEGGEVAREINALYGPKPKKPDEAKSNLEKELGDILFTVACIANREELSLDCAFDYAMEKAYGRDKDRFERK